MLNAEAWKALFLFPIKENDISDMYFWKFCTKIFTIIIIHYFSLLVVIAELRLWHTSLQKLFKIPSNLSELLNNCNGNN